MVLAAEGRGYSVVIINYRGLGGIDLTTPKVYCSFAYMDIQEPMTYVYQKHLMNRKVYAVGTSMGANILANMMGFAGKDCFLDAACVIQAPIKKMGVFGNNQNEHVWCIQQSLGGQPEESFHQARTYVKARF